MEVKDNIKEFGEFYLRVDREPVSLQAKGKKKEDLKIFIREKIKDINVLFSGDIKITITWHIHEELRYETHSVADLDNIVKPLLDALSGKDGIMIDDNQVQSIDCIWLDSYQKEVQFFEIKVKSLLEDYVEKEDLYFINYDNLCLPISLMNKDESKDFLLQCIEIWQKMIDTKKNLLEKGVPYYEAKRVLPIQRFFHKTRIVSEFPIKTREEIVELINS